MAIRSVELETEEIADAVEKLQSSLRFMHKEVLDETDKERS